MSVQWITYKGKRILYTDYRGLTGEAMRRLIHLSIQTSIAEPGGVIALSNVEGVGTNAEFLSYARDEMNAVPADKKLAKQAVVIGSKGVSTFVKKTFINAFITMTGAQIRAFATEEEAKEWLV